LGLSRSEHCPDQDRRELQPSKTGQALYSVGHSLSDRTSSLIIDPVHYLHKHSLTHVTSPSLADSAQYWQKQPLLDRISPLLMQPLHILAGDKLLQNTIGQGEDRNDNRGCGNVLSDGARHVPYGTVTGKAVFGDKLLRYLFIRHKFYTDFHEI
jgi:hypothetical protein